jgi:hypothetical protein
MLLPKDVRPENSLYFNGAFIIKAIKEAGPMRFMDLYLFTREFQEMPIAIFVLALDWLYLASIVRNSDGILELCS